MALASSIITKLLIAGIVFLPSIQPPDSFKTLFLGGAGERGLDIGGKFVKFTAIGVYLEEAAVSSLSHKWKGKRDDELAGSNEFYRDIFTGQFEKLTRVTMILPLKGAEYAEKVSENCVTYLKSVNKYTNAEANAVKSFNEAFRPQTFPRGASIFFTSTTDGILQIAFSEDDAVPESINATIKNQALSEAVLESIIGEHGVSPAVKKSLALRMSQLLK